METSSPSMESMSGVNHCMLNQVKIDKAYFMFLQKKRLKPLVKLSIQIMANPVLHLPFKESLFKKSAI